MLSTWEEKFGATLTRIGRLELRVNALAAFAEGIERLQDPVNRRLADRIDAVERRLEEHQ